MYSPPTTTTLHDRGSSNVVNRLWKINCICQNNSLFYLKRLYVPEECYILCCQVYSKFRVIFVTIEISIFARVGDFLSHVSPGIYQKWSQN